MKTRTPKNTSSSNSGGQLTKSVYPHKKPWLPFRIGEEQPPNSLRIMRRGVNTLVFVCNPLILLFTVVLTVVFVKQEKVKPKILLTGSILLFLLIVLLGQISMFFIAHKQIVEALAQNFEIRDVSSLLVVVDVFRENWQSWALQQAPLAFSISAIYASGYATFRSMRNAAWRRPVEKASEKQIQKTLDSMDLFPETVNTASEYDKNFLARKFSKNKPQNENKVNADSVDINTDSLKLEDLSIRLGVDKHTALPFDVPLGAFMKHTYIDGPIGSGKTTDIVQITRGILENPDANPFKIPLIFINMKPERGLSEIVKQCAINGNREFWHVTENGSTGVTYNPLKNGSPEQVRNILIGAEEYAATGGFSDPYYRNAGERLTLLAIRVLDDLIAQKARYVKNGKWCVWVRDFYHVTRLMTPQALGEIVETLSHTMQAQVMEFLEEATRNKDLVKAGDGMRQRFARASEGATSAVLQEKDSGLVLKQAILDGDVVLFDLDADRDKSGAQQIGNLVIQELASVFAELGSENWHKNDNGKTDRMCMVIIDEFSALGGEHVKGLFQRSRSRGGAIVLATQESQALKEIGESFKAAILTSSNVKIIHRQETNAEEYAEALGTKKTFKESFQTFENNDLLGVTTAASGQGNLKEVEEFVIHPNVYKQLERGETIITVADPRILGEVKIRNSAPMIAVTLEED